MKRPTLSVVMTNYNHAKYLPEAIEAILSQSYRPYEIIISDDASTDNSVEIIEKYVERDGRIKFLRSEKNMGVIHQLNRLLQEATGEYFYSGAADDKIMPGFLEKSMNLLERHPDAGLCSTRSLRLSSDGHEMKILHQPIVITQNGYITPEKALPILQKDGSWILGNTTIFKQKALIECGGFRPELRSFCDGFITQILAVKHGACFIDEPLAAWRPLEDSWSATCGKDPELSLQIVHRASELMSSKYGHLFPPDFVELWERREVLNNKLGCFNDLQTAALEDLKKMIPSQGLIDHSLFGLRKLIKNVEYAFLKFYLYHRNGLPANQLLIQRAKSFRRFFSR